MLSTIKKRSIQLSLLTLILAVNVTPIHSQTLCDSAVSVCPKVFDRLIMNDVLAEKYKNDSSLLAEQNKNLKAEIKNKEENTKDLLSIISTDELEHEGMVKELKKQKSEVEKRDRKIKWLKIQRNLLTAIAIITAPLAYIEVRSIFN